MDRINKILQMLEKSPMDCFLNHALGLEYIKLGNIEDAVTCFRYVLESDADYVGTYYHLAKAFEALHNPEEAIQTYEKGIEVASRLKDHHARNELQMALDELLD